MDGIVPPDRMTVAAVLELARRGGLDPTLVSVIEGAEAIADQVADFTVSTLAAWTMAHPT